MIYSRLRAVLTRETSTDWKSEMEQIPQIMDLGLVALLFVDFICINSLYQRVLKMKNIKNSYLRLADRLAG